MRIIAMDKSFCLSCFTCKVNDLLLHPYKSNFIFRNAMRTCLDQKLGVAIRSMTTSFVNNAPCLQLANSSQPDDGLHYYLIFACLYKASIKFQNSLCTKIVYLKNAMNDAQKCIKIVLTLRKYV